MIDMQFYQFKFDYQNKNIWLVVVNEVLSQIIVANIYHRVQYQKFLPREGDDELIHIGYFTSHIYIGSTN
jgi:hypothetical protein